MPFTTGFHKYSNTSEIKYNGKEGASGVLSSGMWRRVVSKTLIDISEECTASIFRFEELAV
jgi:hypothetical protein